MKASLRSSLLSAVLGGALVAAILIVLGLVPARERTVVQQAPLGTGTAREDGKGLTPREIYKRDAPGVVNVRAQVVRQVNSPFDLTPPGGRGVASGSGFVIDDQGHLLTNAHVIEGASKITVQFEDRKTVEGEVIGKDTSSDLALLKVDPKGLNLKPLQFGNSRNVQVGDPTVAIGNPFGLDRTLTTGVVSALQRRIEAPDGFSIEDVIQTDAAINPGNSGGPLLDAAGRVIGINSQIATSSGGNVGIAFAVPINTAKEVIPQLKDDGRVSRPYMGITGLTIDSTLDRLNLAAKSGVLVQTVQGGSPAAKAGIRGGDAETTFDGSEIRLGGDVITRVDDRKIVTMDDVVSEVNEHKPGDKLRVELLRDEERKTVTVTLDRRPDRAPQR